MRNEILEPGTIVQHFKREGVSKDIRELSDQYLYRVIGVALDTTTKNKVVVYQALYDVKNVECSLFVRPLDEFMSTIDKTRYPNIQSEYRFIKYIGD